MSSSDPTLGEVFRGYLDRDNPRLLGKVDFGAIIRDTGRAAVASVFVGLSMIVLAFWDGVVTVIGAAESALRGVLLAIGLSPTVLQPPAQAATVEAIGGTGFLGLPIAVGTQLVSFGIIAFVIALAWGSS